MAVIVEGLTEVQRNLIAIQASLHPVLEEAMIMLGNDGEDKAKKNCPKDTGALQASIHNDLVKSLPEYIEVDIIAGDPNVSRGLGSFTIGRDGYPASVKATTEYASFVEDNFGYMYESAMWLEKNAPARIKNYLKVLL